MGEVVLPSSLIGIISGLESRIAELERRGTRFLTYTTATRPTASSVRGLVIFVSDGGAGAKFQGSDGTSWLPLG